MTERAKVGDPLNIHSRPIFRPAATPVDTYVRPAAPKESKGTVLRDALSAVQQSLSPVIQKEFKQSAKREYERGQELYQETRENFADAVRDGDVPMGASPFVRRGYRESQLNVQAAQYNIELQRRLEHSNLEAEEDPEVIEQFIADFDEEFIAANGLSEIPQTEFSRVFRPQALQAQNNFRNEQGSRNIAYVEEARFRSFQNEVYLATTQGRFSGPEGSAAADAKNLADWLEARAQDMVEEGIDPEQVENLILQSVSQVALERTSNSTMSVLNGITVAGRPPLRETMQARGVRQNISNRIAAQEQARARAAQAAANRERAIAAQNTISQANAAAWSGDLETAERLRDQVNQTNPSAARSIQVQIRQARGDGEDAFREGGLGTVVQGIAGAPDVETAYEQVYEGVNTGLLNPRDVGTAMGVADDMFRVDELRVGGLEALEGDTALQRIRADLSSQFPLTVDGFNVDGAADDLVRAEREFDDSMVEYLTNNPGDRAGAITYAREVFDSVSPTMNSRPPQAAQTSVQPLGASLSATQSTGAGIDNNAPDWAQ